MQGHLMSLFNFRSGIGTSACFLLLLLLLLVVIVC